MTPLKPPGLSTITVIVGNCNLESAERGLISLFWHNAVRSAVESGSTVRYRAEELNSRSAVRCKGSFRSPFFFLLLRSPPLLFPLRKVLNAFFSAGDKQRSIERAEKRGEGARSDSPKQREVHRTGTALVPYSSVFLGAANFDPLRGWIRARCAKRRGVSVRTRGSSVRWRTSCLTNEG